MHGQQQQQSWRRLLLLAAVAAAVLSVSAAEASAGIGCGHSWQSAICRDAPAEFAFSDGCNRVTCDARGEYITTLMACPEAATEAEKRRCGRIREEVQSRVDAAFTVACPTLAIEAVCATAAKGFTYSDGCNTIACDGVGSGISTFMWCPGPTTTAERDSCDRRTRKLIEERLEARTCRGINSTAVCAAEGIGFKFSDGCNTVECGPDATWTSTLMMCPPAPSNSAICIWAVRRARVGPAGRSGAGGGREFACPSLAVSRVCTAEVVGFRYNDGCNGVHCVSTGNAVSTFRLCPPAGDGEAEAETAYCARAEADMRAKRGQSKARVQCLTAADACTGQQRTAFFDGCNYCFCMGAGRAGCTRRACRPYFSTEEEFRTECLRRKAGVIN